MSAVAEAPSAPAVAEEEEEEALGMEPWIETLRCTSCNECTNLNPRLFSTSMNFRRDVPPDEPEVNFIPLIDLLLVILIFLMVSTTFTRYTQLKVDLPAASKVAATEQPDEIVVEVSADGQYRFAHDKSKRSPAWSFIGCPKLEKSLW